VLGYYISKGTVSLEEAYGATRGLFISGIRPEPRTILPFLGQHRVASVLLEPVSMGNLGVILYAWALFRRDYAGRWVILPIALSLVALADARFGLMTCILTTLLFPFLRIMPRIIWLALPFILLSLIAAYGLATDTNGGPNDILGRIQVTAHILTELDPAIVLGFQTTSQFTADSGLAYTLTKFGIIGFVALWAALVFVPVRDSRAWAFRAMAIIYLLLLMVISNSFYSIKTAGLLWFLVGTTATASIPAVKSWWRLALRPADRKGMAAPLSV
jgi:putative polymerase